MKVVAVKRNLKGNWNKENVDNAYTMKDVYQAVNGSRFVINCLPLTEETRDFADKNLFDAMD